MRILLINVPHPSIGSRIPDDHLPPLGLLSIGGPLIAVGLFTRPTAFILSGEMAVAYFLGHFPNGFWPHTNMGEPAVLLCFVFLYIAAKGSGLWSVDSLRGAPAAKV